MIRLLVIPFFVVCVIGGAVMGIIPGLLLGFHVGMKRAR